MATHVQMIEDDRGDLVDARYYDSLRCALDMNYRTAKIEREKVEAVYEQVRAAISRAKGEE